MNDKAAERYAIATWAFVAMAAAYSMAMRIYLAWDLPLWLDESWTAVLSAAPSLPSFLWQMRLDSNAPAYYTLMWLWPFESSFGLKVPSLIFLLLSCAVAIFWRPAQVRLDQALFWAALMLLWVLGVSMFLDARYYALLFLISTAQTVAYVRLLSKATLGNAAAWTSIATAAVLTHYFAALPALLQGLYYLGRYRKAAIATWPAALLILPAIAWGAYHFPRLQVYARPGVSWYSTLDPGRAAEFLLWPLGGGIAAAITLVLAVLLRSREPVARPILATCAIAGASTVVLLALGTVVPFFVPRYLIPMVPPLLLAVAVVARKVAYLPIAACMFIPVSSISQWAEHLHTRSGFGLEKPAGALPRARTVTWMIDYPGSRIHVPSQMEAMLEDAFRRNGRPIEKARWGTDFEAGDGLLLIYRNGLPRTVSTPPGWPCTAFSAVGHTTLACSRPEEFRQRNSASDQTHG